jgi:hypothetical protein
MLETQQEATHGASMDEVYLRMSRIDIGDYLGISPEGADHCASSLVWAPSPCEIIDTSK